MPTNKGALIRRQIIDACLSNRSRNYTLLDLMRKCNDALADHGFKLVSSENTIRTDIQEIEYQFSQGEVMRIRRGRNIFYQYKNKDFSIYNVPLKSEEVLGLTQALSVLGRFDGMPGFEWLDGLIKRYKPQLGIDTSVKHVVGFDENIDLKGKEHYATLLQAIINQQVLLIRYCGYKNPQEFSAIIHPYYLKQYNNRWFLFGLNDELNVLTNFAFDRILEITPIPKSYRPNTEIDFFEFFDDMIGVSRQPDDEPQEVQIFVHKSQLPYILSKPLHGTQRIVEKSPSGAVISIKVIINFELESVILALGEKVKVLSPTTLVEQISCRISKASKNYQYPQ